MWLEIFWPCQKVYQFAGRNSFLPFFWNPNPCYFIISLLSYALNSTQARMVIYSAYIFCVNPVFLPFFALNALISYRTKQARQVFCAHNWYSCVSNIDYYNLFVELRPNKIAASTYCFPWLSTLNILQNLVWLEYRCFLF